MWVLYTGASRCVSNYVFADLAKVASFGVVQYWLSQFFVILALSQDLIEKHTCRRWACLCACVCVYMCILYTCRGTQIYTCSLSLFSLTLFYSFNVFLQGMPNTHIYIVRSSIHLKLSRSHVYVIKVLKHIFSNTHLTHTCQHIKPTPLYDGSLIVVSVNLQEFRSPQWTALNRAVSRCVSAGQCIILQCNGIENDGNTIQICEITLTT